MLGDKSVMTKKKSIVIYIFILIGVIISTMIIISYINNPLQKSANRIREDILKFTPVGMSMDEVEIVIRAENWRIAEGSSERGYINPNPSLPIEQRIVGEKYIGADIGISRYLIILSQSIRVYWGFDEDGKLIDVYVTKYLNI